MDGGIRLAMVEGVAFVVGIGVLGLTVAAHVRRPSSLRTAIRLHGVVKSPVGGAIALTLLVMAETAVAATLLVALLRPQNVAPWAALALASFLFLVLCSYSLAALLKSNGQVPCGCGDQDSDLNAGVVVRSGLLASLMAAGSAMGPPISELGLLGLFVCVIVGIGLGVVIWLLPAALQIPASQHEAYAVSDS